MSKARIFSLLTVAQVSFMFEAHAAIQGYISPPGHQTAEAAFSGVGSGTGVNYTFYTENMNNSSILGQVFNDALSGTTYSLDPATEVIDPDDPGFVKIVKITNDGFGGDGTGSYLTVTGEDSSFTWNLASSVNYFGLLWTAGDGGNSISFYNDADELIGVFTTDYLMNMVLNDNSTMVTAIDNTQHYTGYYYGVPENGWPGANTSTLTPDLDYNRFNGGEPYAYLHFINSDNNPATRIRKIVLTQTWWSGFENDNHTIRVLVDDLDPENLIFIKTVPEVNHVGYLIFGILKLVTHRSRRKFTRSK